MRVLILGITGFVGRAIAHRLLAEGFTVVGTSRQVDFFAKQMPQVRLIPCDFMKDVLPGDWLSRLEGIDIVINCVGIFYHTDKTRVWKIHFDAPKALYEAAALQNVKQIIHCSALGIEHYSNEYAYSKKAIENWLSSSSIPHVILRPSFIYGSGFSGGMGMLRMLAAMPGLIPVPGYGMQLFQPIHVDDLALAVRNLIVQPATTHARTLAAVSPEPIALRNMLLTLRQWLGLSKGFFIHVPLGLLRQGARIGDKTPYSRWNTQAIGMLEQGCATIQEEVQRFQQETQVVPVNFVTGLQKQEDPQVSLWYARFLLMKPLLRVSLALMWLLSALTSALPANKMFALALLQQTGLSITGQFIALYAAIFLNALLGIGLLIHYKTKLNCLLQLIVVLAYTVIITIKLPYLWLEPFGPVVKNIPVIMSIVILFILES